MQGTLFPDTVYIQKSKPVEDIGPTPTVSVFVIVYNTVTVSNPHVVDVVRRPCSDFRHVTAPKKLSYYYYFGTHGSKDPEG